MTAEKRVTIWFLCGIILLVFGLTVVGSLLQGDPEHLLLAI